MTVLCIALILLANGVRRSNSTINGTTNATQRTTLTKRILAASGGRVEDFVMTTNRLPTAQEAPTMTFALTLVLEDLFSASADVSSVRDEHESHTIINNGQKNAIQRTGYFSTLAQPTMIPKIIGHKSIIVEYVVVTAMSPFSR